MANHSIQSSIRSDRSEGIDRADATVFGCQRDVSPRTRYNDYVLPAMSLSATVGRDGSSAFDDILTAVVGPELGYHYGVSVDEVESGDELAITTVARSLASPSKLGRLD